MPLSNEQNHNATAIIEWFCLSLWAGGSIALSLFAFPQAFRILPRPQAGLYASSLFPIYFGVSAALLAGILFLQGRRGLWNGRNARATTVFLFIAILGIFINLAVALPKLDGVPGMQAAVEERQKAFRMWHGVSMAANALTLLTTVPLVALTAIRKTE